MILSTITKEQTEACEKLAEKRSLRQASTGCNHLNKAVSRYLKIGFEDGFQAAQTPEMLLLNPLVKGLVDALANQKNRNIDALAMIANGLLQECPDCDYECASCHKVRNEIDDQQIELEKALAPFKEGE